MDNPLQEVKDLVIVRALALIATGSSKKEACEICQISTTTFDRITTARPELITSFVAREHGKIQEMYEQIGSAHQQTVEMLLRDSASEDLKVSERLAIELRLRELQGIVERQLVLTQAEIVPVPGGKLPDDAASAFLKTLTGPKLRKATSVTTVEFDYEEDESLEVSSDMPVLDAETIDSKDTVD